MFFHSLYLQHKAPVSAKHTEGWSESRCPPLGEEMCQLAGGAGAQPPKAHYHTNMHLSLPYGFMGSSCGSRVCEVSPQVVTRPLCTQGRRRFPLNRQRDEESKEPAELTQHLAVLWPAYSSWSWIRSWKDNETHPPVSSVNTLCSSTYACFSTKTLETVILTRLTELR